MAANTKMFATVVRDSNDAPILSRDEIPIPSPADHQVLVKISHVAQNPTDGKSLLQSSKIHDTILY